MHVAVEEGKIELVKFLINEGCNVNCKERCGLTPLNLAVLAINVEMCKLLLLADANCRGPLFTSILSPSIVVNVKSANITKR